MQKITNRGVALVAGLTSFLTVALAGVASATEGAATYSVAPVTESITANVTSNLPLILGVAGGLIALALVIRMARKFVKA